MFNLVPKNIATRDNVLYKKKEIKLIFFYLDTEVQLHVEHFSTKQIFKNLLFEKKHAK